LGLGVDAVGRFAGDLGADSMKEPFSPHEMYFLPAARAVGLHKFEQPGIGIRGAIVVPLGRCEIHPRSDGVIPISRPPISPPGLGRGGRWMRQGAARRRQPHRQPAEQTDKRPPLAALVLVPPEKVSNGIEDDAAGFVLARRLLYCGKKWSRLDEPILAESSD